VSVHRTNSVTNTYTHTHTLLMAFSQGCQKMLIIAIMGFFLSLTNAPMHIIMFVSKRLYSELWHELALTKPDYV